MNKRKDKAFGKDVYLLGADEFGERYWLAAPSWDCGWYWGFGYVASYQGNRLPSRAEDIQSHLHAKGFLIGEIDDRYVHNPFRTSELDLKTFTEAEGWELGELFAQFYILRDMADLCKHGGAGVSPSGLDHGDLSAMRKRINEKMIPAITARVLAILSPEEK